MYKSPNLESNLSSVKALEMVPLPNEEEQWVSVRVKFFLDGEEHFQMVGPIPVEWVDGVVSSLREAVESLKNNNT